MTYAREGLGISVPYSGGATGLVNPYYAGGTVTWGGAQVPKSVPWTLPSSPITTVKPPVTSVPVIPAVLKPPTPTTVISPKPLVSLAPTGGGGGVTIPTGSFSPTSGGGVASESSDMSSGFMSAFADSPMLLVVLGLGALLLMDRKGRR